MRGLALLVGVVVCQAADQVLLVRHCVRSMYPTLRGRGDPNFDFSNNYTAYPFPTQEEWKADGVAHCTQNGLKISHDYAASLQQKFALSLPITVVADNISRCIQTAQQMASGFGRNAVYKGITQALDPVTNKLCPPSSPKNKTKGVSSMIELAQSSHSYLSKTWKQRDQLKAQLQDFVGKGVAPSISDIPDHINSQGNYIGGMHVSSQGMLENFILEAGSNMSVAWGAFDGEARKLLWEHFSPLNVLYNQINHNSVTLASRDGSIAVGIFQHLLESGNGSVVFVGHDTNVDNVAALLGLTWQCGSYADNESPPHIGLLFSRHGAHDASVEIVCAALDGSYGNIPGTALTGVVKRDQDIVSKVSIKSSLQEVRDKLNYWGGLECVSAPMIEESLSTVVV